MKKIRSILMIALAAMAASCEKDNYDGPTAALYGTIFDAATKQPLEQDIIHGSVVELREHGYENVTPQMLIMKVDGTYENSLLFENTYTVAPVRGNFIPVETQEVVIKGRTQLDFSVTPYIRVLDATITKSGNIVTAKFRVQQNVINNVRKIGLYAHSDFRVGEPMRLADTEQTINGQVDPNTVFTLTMDISTKPDLKAGKKYYFRIGALIDAPESKCNYAKVASFDL